jgi:hypothetical protein
MTEATTGRRLHDIVATVSLCLVGLMAAGYLLPLFIRSTYKFQIMYNEGWTVYHSQQVAEGLPLYGQAPQYSVVNYPPLSFYVVNAARSLTGDPLLAGRLVSALSLLLAAGLLGGIVFAMTRSAASGVLGCLLMLVLLARYGPDYVGTNDPHLLGEAIMMAGILLFVAASSPAITVLSAVTIGTALFVKHSIVSFPAAIAIVLLASNRKRFAIWAAALGGTILFWTAFSIYAQGPYFFGSILTPRMFKTMRAPRSFLILLNAIQLPFAAAALWLLVDRTARYWKLLVVAFGLAIAFGLFASRGDGAWVNHWFDVIIVVSIAVSVAWARAEAFWLAAGWDRRFVLALFPVLLTLGAAAQEVLPQRLMELTSLRKEWAIDEAALQADVEYERSRPGPAICENLSLCAYAGKILEYEPFGAREKILKDPAAAVTIAGDLRSHRYQTVQLDVTAGEEIGSGGRALFPEQFMQALLANYHIDRRSAERVFFVPNTEAASTASSNREPPRW